MNLLRALLVLFALTYSAATAAVVQSQSVQAQTQTVVAAVDAPAEDVTTQEQVVESAYNLLMDRFVHPLASADLGRAAWDELSKELDGKGPQPGAPPAFDGDR